MQSLYFYGFSVQVLALILWWTLWHQDHVWPDSPSLVARCKTPYSVTFLMIMRCYATLCLVLIIAHMQKATLNFSLSPTRFVSICVLCRSCISTRAAGSYSSDVCCTPTPGDARSVCRTAEDGYGAAVAAWASHAWRSTPQSGRLLQVRSLNVGEAWYLFFMCTQTFQRKYDHEDLPQRDVKVYY